MAYQFPIVSGYESPIYAEDGVTIVTPGALTMVDYSLDENLTAAVLIVKVNDDLHRIFSDQVDEVTRRGLVDVLVTNYKYDGILNHYAWLIEYMSLEGLKFIKPTVPQQAEQIDAAIAKLEKGTQKIIETN